MFFSPVWIFASQWCWRAISPSGLSARSPSCHLALPLCFPQPTASTSPPISVPVSSTFLSTFPFSIRFFSRTKPNRGDWPQSKASCHTIRLINAFFEVAYDTLLTCSVYSIAPTYTQADCPYPLKIDEDYDQSTLINPIEIPAQLCVYPCPDPEFSTSEYNGMNIPHPHSPPHNLILFSYSKVVGWCLMFWDSSPSSRACSCWQHGYWHPRIANSLGMWLSGWSCAPPVSLLLRYGLSSGEVLTTLSVPLLTHHNLFACHTSIPIMMPDVSYKVSKEEKKERRKELTIFYMGKRNCFILLCSGCKSVVARYLYISLRGNCY